MLVSLRWWFMFCASVVLTFVAGAFGWLTWLWKADVSHLSFVALGIYFTASGFVGYITEKARKGWVEYARMHTNVAWYASELLLGIGMAGTLVGTLIMLSSGFSNFNPADTAAAQAVIGSVAHGLSTAGLSTLLGLAGSFALKAQIVNLGYLIDGDAE